MRMVIFFLKIVSKMELCMVFQISGMRMALFITKVNTIKEKNLDPGTIGITTEN